MQNVFPREIFFHSNWIVYRILAVHTSVPDLARLSIPTAIADWGLLISCYELIETKRKGKKKAIE